MANTTGIEEINVGGTPYEVVDAAARKMISDEYNSAETYAKGNLCIYSGKLYTAIKETTGTWDATAWKETTLAEVNVAMQSDITNLTDKSTTKLTNKITFGGNVYQTISGKTVMAYIMLSSLTLEANKYTDIAVNEKDPVSTYKVVPAVFFNAANNAVVATGAAVYNSGTIQLFANAAVTNGRVFAEIVFDK